MGWWRRPHRRSLIARWWRRWWWHLAFEPLAVRHVAARQQRGTVVTVTDVRNDDYEKVLIVNVRATRDVVSSPQGDFQVTVIYTCQQVAE